MCTKNTYYPRPDMAFPAETAHLGKLETIEIQINTQYRPFFCKLNIFFYITTINSLRWVHTFTHKK